MRSQRAVWGLILNAASLRMFVRNKFPFCVVASASFVRSVALFIRVFVYALLGHPNIWFSNHFIPNDSTFWFISDRLGWALHCFTRHFR
jgi:hypothetical protein